MFPDTSTLMTSLGFIILLIVIYIFIIRWVFRINDIVFYLDKINEKLYKMEQERASANEQQ